MCGIVGVISTEPVDGENLEKMVQALRHRGPDARGVFFSDDRKVFLGHTRLCIIDLSDIANQPLHSSDNNYVIVFNGEIYNFQLLKRILEKEYFRKFYTQSDTEVILEAYAVWGDKMIERLEGMFSLIIYDKRKSTVFICRDRLGKKPLYYYASPERFIFSSEIKGLIHFLKDQNKTSLNKEAIANFLHLGYIPEPLSIYKDVSKFPAGHCGTLSLNMKMDLREYWHPKEQFFETQSNLSTVEYISQFRSLLSNAVAKRMISDVPLGTFLSGGVDSSLVTALATENSSERINTFAIGFNESKYDESKYARKVAKKLNTNHSEFILSQQDSLDLMETYFEHFDEPFADTSVLPFMLISKMARQYVKVILTGDGGDELFLGYGSYSWAKRLDNKVVQLLKAPIRKILNSIPSSRYKRVSHLFESVSRQELLSHIFSQEQYYFSNSEIKDRILLTNEGFDLFQAPNIDLNLSAMETQAFFDLTHYLKDDLLVKVDMASMLYGLECRCPLLDVEITRFAANLPVSFKKRAGTSKWIEKKLLEEFLPHELIYRNKWGFSIPLEYWLKNDLKSMLHDYLSESSVRQTGFLNWYEVKRLKEQFLNGNDYLYHRLWLLIVLQKWMIDKKCYV